MTVLGLIHFDLSSQEVNYMAEVWMKGDGVSFNNEYLHILHDMSGWKYNVFILPVFTVHDAPCSLKV